MLINFIGVILGSNKNTDQSSAGSVSTGSVSTGSVPTGSEPTSQFSSGNQDLPYGHEGMIKALKQKYVDRQGVPHEINLDGLLNPFFGEFNFETFLFNKLSLSSGIETQIVCRCKDHGKDHDVKSKNNWIFTDFNKIGFDYDYEPTRKCCQRYFRIVRYESSPSSQKETCPSNQKETCQGIYDSNGAKNDPVTFDKANYRYEYHSCLLSMFKLRNGAATIVDNDESSFYYFLDVVCKANVNGHFIRSNDNTRSCGIHCPEGECPNDLKFLAILIFLSEGMLNYQFQYSLQGDNQFVRLVNEKYGFEIQLPVNKSEHGKGVEHGKGTEYEKRTNSLGETLKSIIYYFNRCGIIDAYKRIVEKKLRKSERSGNDAVEVLETPQFILQAYIYKYATRSDANGYSKLVKYVFDLLDRDGDEKTASDRKKALMEKYFRSVDIHDGDELSSTKNIHDSKNELSSAKNVYDSKNELALYKGYKTLTTKLEENFRKFPFSPFRKVFQETATEYYDRERDEFCYKSIGGNKLLERGALGKKFLNSAETTVLNILCVTFYDYKLGCFSVEHLIKNFKLSKSAGEIDESDDEENESSGAESNSSSTDSDMSDEESSSGSYDADGIEKYIEDAKRDRILKRLIRFFRKYKTVKSMHENEKEMMGEFNKIVQDLPDSNIIYLEHLERDCKDGDRTNSKDDRNKTDAKNDRNKTNSKNDRNKTNSKDGNQIAREGEPRIIRNKLSNNIFNIFYVIFYITNHFKGTEEILEKYKTEPEKFRKEINTLMHYLKKIACYEDVRFVDLYNYTDFENVRTLHTFINLRWENHNECLRLRLRGTEVKGASFELRTSLSMNYPPNEGESAKMKEKAVFGFHMGERIVREKKEEPERVKNYEFVEEFQRVISLYEDNGKGSENGNESDSGKGKGRRHDNEEKRKRDGQGQIETGKKNSPKILPLLKKFYDLKIDSYFDQGLENDPKRHEKTIVRIDELIKRAEKNLDHLINFKEEIRRVEPLSKNYFTLESYLYLLDSLWKWRDTGKIKKSGKKPIEESRRNSGGEAERICARERIAIDGLGGSSKGTGKPASGKGSEDSSSNDGEDSGSIKDSSRNAKDAMDSSRNVKDSVDSCDGDFAMDSCDGDFVTTVDGPCAVADSARKRKGMHKRNKRKAKPIDRQALSRFITNLVFFVAQEVNYEEDRAFLFILLQAVHNTSASGETGITPSSSIALMINCSFVKEHLLYLKSDGPKVHYMLYDFNKRNCPYINNLAIHLLSTVYRGTCGKEISKIIERKYSGIDYVKRARLPSSLFEHLLSFVINSNLEPAIELLYDNADIVFSNSKGDGSASGSNGRKVPSDKDHPFNDPNKLIALMCFSYRKRFASIDANWILDRFIDLMEEEDVPIEIRYCEFLRNGAFDYNNFFWVALAEVRDYYKNELGRKFNCDKIFKLVYYAVENLKGADAKYRCYQMAYGLEYFNELRSGAQIESSDICYVDKDRICATMNFAGISRPLGGAESGNAGTAYLESDYDEPDCQMETDCLH